MQDRGGHRRRCFDDSGAALVEFALIAPVLFVLLFGIFEFGYVFGQHLEVRHAARESARLAAVDFGSEAANQSEAFGNAVCQSMTMAGGATVTATTDPTSGAERGDFVIANVTAGATQITGFFSWVLDGVELTSQVEMRLEQDPSYTTMQETCP